MQDKVKKSITAVISAAFLTVFLLTNGLNAFAADSSGKTSISKGMTAFIMVIIFIATALITGFITFKLRKNKLRQSADENSSENDK